MVFTTSALLIRTRGPDRFWRRRRILRLSAHFYGRRWNCYTVAIKGVHRALVYATKSRPLKKKDFRELCEARISAACKEHGIHYETFHRSLVEANILLNTKVLADLSIWEPKTFKSLAHFARSEPASIGLNLIKKLDGPSPVGVFTRGMLKK